MTLLDGGEPDPNERKHLKIEATRLKGARVLEEKVKRDDRENEKDY